jgi:hypothetical protein
MAGPMLTSVEIAALNTIAHHLAVQEFAGEASVALSSEGYVRLTLMKTDHGGGGLYRVREVSALTFENARLEIAAAIDSANHPSGVAA